MSSSPVLTVSHGGRAVVRLNRPKHHNRVEPADIEAIEEALVAVEEDETLRVLVLTGTGTTFCAGYDLVTLASGGSAVESAKGEHALHAFERVVDQLEACRLPTVCGLNGPAYGGGTDLALACDFRIGVAATRMVVPASELGVHYYHGGLRRFVTRLGLSAATRLFLLSQPIDAAEMLRIGFLHEVVPTIDDLQNRIDEIASHLAAAPVPAVLTSMKRALHRIARGDMNSDATDAAWEASVRSPAVSRAAAERLNVRPLKAVPKK